MVEPTGCGAGPAGARKGWRLLKLAPGEREGPSRPRPWQAVAVAGTAGTVGSVEGSSLEGHGRVTDPSPKSDLVTQMPGTSPFLPSSPGSAPVRSQFSPLCGGNCELILPGVSLPGRTVTEGRPSCRPWSSFPTAPSRPGRLVAAAACQGRHETPGTWLGRAAGPGARPSRPR